MMHIKLTNKDGEILVNGETSLIAAIVADEYGTLYSLIESDGDKVPCNYVMYGMLSLCSNVRDLITDKTADKD